MVNIIVKRFEPHFNRSLDKAITSERQYREEMKRGGYISYEEAKERDKNSQEKRDAEKFKVSKPVVDILRSVKDKSDRKGNVKLSDRQIDAMKKHGLRTGEKIKSKITDMVGG